MGRGSQHRILLLVGGVSGPAHRAGVTGMWPVLFKLLFATNPLLR